MRVGGVDVRSYDLEALRDQVAVVLQKNVLFSGSIRENLRWGNKDATDAEMEEACRLAQADEFIRQFPDGYDTHIEQGGANVSGGQKQRLCIARALLKKPQDPGPGRFNQCRGYAHRRTDPPGAAPVYTRNDKDHHCPAHRLRTGRGPHRRHGRRRGECRGHPCGAYENKQIYREVYTSQNKAGDDDAE